MKVLAIDDSAAVRRALKRIMSVRYPGVEITEASSAEEAKALLAVQTFDVILSDVDMPPGQDGISLMREVRSHRPFQAYVLMTGRADEVAQLVDIAVLEKPSEPDMIFNALVAALAAVRA